MDDVHWFSGARSLGTAGQPAFQIAATIGVARRNGCEFLIPPWPSAGYFRRPVPQSSAVPATINYVEQAFSYQEINVTRSTSLLGYFQSEKYFKHCEDEVRSFSAPCSGLTQQLQEKFRDLLGRKTCSVHVRRTDYINDGCYNDLAAGSYYEEAFARFDADTTFVLFSDDTAWCRRRFRDERIVFIDGTAEIEDLFLMSFCQSHVIANSSFSWSGARLNPNTQKRVIAPARWFDGPRADPTVPFRPGPCHGGFHDSKDIVPDGWIKL